MLLTLLESLPLAVLVNPLEVLERVELEFIELLEAVDLLESTELLVLVELYLETLEEALVCDVTEGLRIALEVKDELVLGFVDNMRLRELDFEDDFDVTREVFDDDDGEGERSWSDDDDDERVEIS
jgi:hypothetical protein